MASTSAAAACHVAAAAVATTVAFLLNYVRTCTTVEYQFQIERKSYLI